MTVTNSESDRKPVSARSGTARRYDSSLRREGAADTRRRIIEAATVLFSRDGYASTTLRAIAKEAGVSVETVNGHGPKGALLFAAFDIAFAGREGGAPMSERDDYQPVFDVKDPESALRLSVAATTDAFERSGGIWRALTAAADVDTEVAQSLDELLDRRNTEFLGWLALLGTLGLEMPRHPQVMTDVSTYVLTHESYLHLVKRAGWTRERYERWVVATLLGQNELVNDW